MVNELSLFVSPSLCQFTDKVTNLIVISITANSLLVVRSFLRYVKSLWAPKSNSPKKLEAKPSRNKQYNVVLHFVIVVFAALYNNTRYFFTVFLHLVA